MQYRVYLGELNKAIEHCMYSFEITNSKRICSNATIRRAMAWSDLHTKITSNIDLSWLETRMREKYNRNLKYYCIIAAQARESFSLQHKEN